MMERVRAAFAPPSPADHELLNQALSRDARLTFNFMVLTLASCAIATFGLLENNVAVIIGAMIVAPLILPLGPVAYGALEGDARLLRRGVITVVAGTVLAVGLAALLTLAFGFQTFGSEILSRSQPNLLDLGVAIAAGLVAAFARVQPKVAGTVAGTAIAVALMPPLCVVGIALAGGAHDLARGATLLYITNLLGIIIASMAVYAISRHARIHRAGVALFWTTLAMAVILIPLGASTGNLLRQSRVEATLRNALLNGTVTFQRVDLLRTDFNWLASPPEVHLLVRSRNALTPNQVQQLQAFATRKTGLKFKFFFDVSPITEVTDTGSATAPEPTP
ncbi:MAG: DUF389 domain-containing protein [Candidatus Eremiobacteraeota bacterium]|nr:DUF389 domain-containing protein [Candidatus Eremiobacteraeota bacterium]